MIRALHSQEIHGSRRVGRVVHPHFRLELEKTHRLNGEGECRLTLGNEWVWVYRKEPCTWMYPAECCSPANPRLGVTLAVEWNGPIPESKYLLSPYDTHETPLHALARMGDEEQARRVLRRGWAYAVELPSSTDSISLENLFQEAMRTLTRVDVDLHSTSFSCHPEQSTHDWISVGAPLQVARESHFPASDNLLDLLSIS